MRLSIIAIVAVMLGLMPATASAAVADPQPANVEVGYGHIKPAPVDKYERLYHRIPRFIRKAFDRVGQCESTGNIRINTGNGFYGFLQFTKRTWNSVAGMPGYPHLASKARQVWGGWKTAHIQGWGAWPVCAPKAGATSINIRAARLTRRPH